MSLTTLTLFGVEYLVDYSFTKGYPATLEEPGYDDEFEINGISTEPSEENYADYVSFLEEYCRNAVEWINSGELHDMILAELYDARNEYESTRSSYDFDYDDNTDDVYFD